MTQTASVTMVERLRLLAQGARFPAVPVVIEAADALETAEKALESLSRKYAAAYAAVEFAHDEGFEWPTDPFGEEAMLFADPTIVPEYAALEKIRSGR
jgi:hypothetical protein